MLSDGYFTACKVTCRYHNTSDVSHDHDPPGTHAWVPSIGRAVVDAVMPSTHSEQIGEDA